MDEILSRLAKKYAVNEGEICLRWCVDQDIVPVTTSSREQRLSDYLRAMTFKLTPKEVKMVSLTWGFPLPGFLVTSWKRWFADSHDRSTRPAHRSTSAGFGTTSSRTTIGVS